MQFLPDEERGIMTPMDLVVAILNAMKASASSTLEEKPEPALYVSEDSEGNKFDPFTGKPLHAMPDSPLRTEWHAQIAERMPQILVAIDQVRAMLTPANALAICATLDLVTLERDWIGTRLNFERRVSKTVAAKKPRPNSPHKDRYAKVREIAKRWRNHHNQSSAGRAKFMQIETKAGASKRMVEEAFSLAKTLHT